MKLVGAILLLYNLVLALPLQDYTVVKEIPHSEDAFTQGLLFFEGNLWESTGSPGGGTRLRKLSPLTGEVLTTIFANTRYFGEGLATDGDMLYQLSWKEQLVHIFTYPHIKEIGQLSYIGEGWGLTYHKDHFYMSNGSDTMYVRNKNFKITKRIPVQDSGTPITNINELEYINGKIYANIWFSDSIAIINSTTGNVESYINLKPLRDSIHANSSEQVANGIAYYKDNQIWVTGKFWSKIFLIELQ